MATDSGHLKISALSLSFGGLKALNDITITVRKGELLAVIGPNGAGKTALLNCINGFYRPQHGSIVFNGTPITHFSGHKIARLG